MKISARTFVRFLVVLFVFLATSATSLAKAATVYCQAHAPYGTYQAFLFRTGDRSPIAATLKFTIDGGKVVSFSGVSGGARYFIRVVQTDGLLKGQTQDGYLNYYFSTPLNLGDCWVTPP